MSGVLTRFLHASDLKLGTPLFGVAGLPRDLRSLMVDARYRAAERVFDVALAEEVDFLVLSGGVLGEFGVDPRGMWFFAEQCERLARKRIPVYWIEEAGVLANWADYVPLPANVYQADTQIGQAFESHSDGGSAVHILAGSDVRARSSSGADVTICVLPDGLEGQPLSAEGVDYWALGGRAAPGAVPAICGLAQYAGSPQGRAPSEPGPHGCQLVTVDGEKQVTSRFFATDAVRWHEERMAVSEHIDWRELCEQLQSRKRRLARSTEAKAVMVRWVLEGHGVLWQQLLREDVCDRLLAALRDRPGASPARIWSMIVEPVPDLEESDAWSHVEQPFTEFAAALAGAGSTSEAPLAGAGRHPLSGPHFSDGVRQRALREAARVLANGGPQ